MMIVSKSSTETSPSKNPKNPENNPQTWYVIEIFSYKYDQLYIVGKLLTKTIQ